MSTFDWVIGFIEKLGLPIALVCFGLWATVRVAQFFAPKITNLMSAITAKQELQAKELQDLVQTVKHTSIQNSQAITFLARSYDDLVNYIKYGHIHMHGEFEKIDSVSKGKSKPTDNTTKPDSNINI